MQEFFSSKVLRGKKVFFKTFCCTKRPESKEHALSSHTNSAKAAAVFTGNIKQLLQTSEINCLPKVTFPA